MKYKLNLHIPKKQLEAYLKIAEANWDKDDKDNCEGKEVGKGYIFELELPNESMEIQSDGEMYYYGDFKLPKDNDPVFYNLTIEFDAIDTVKFCEIVTKKMNKAKALFESLAG